MCAKTDVNCRRGKKPPFGASAKKGRPEMIDPIMRDSPGPEQMRKPMAARVVPAAWRGDAEEGINRLFCVFSA